MPFAQLFQSTVRPPTWNTRGVVTCGASASSPFVPITSRPSETSMDGNALSCGSPVGMMPCGSLKEVRP